MNSGRKMKRDMARRRKITKQFRTLVVGGGSIAIDKDALPVKSQKKHINKFAPPPEPTEVRED